MPDGDPLPPSPPGPNDPPPQVAGLVPGVLVSAGWLIRVLGTLRRESYQQILMLVGVVSIAFFGTDLAKFAITSFRDGQASDVRNHQTQMEMQQTVFAAALDKTQATTTALVESQQRFYADQRDKDRAFNATELRQLHDTLTRWEVIFARAKFAILGDDPPETNPAAVAPMPRKKDGPTSPPG